MQKMLFTDNSGTNILPFTQSSSGCFWSASVDIESGKSDILLKVANNKAMPEVVSIVLKGTVNIDPIGKYSSLAAALETENSINEPTKVVPETGTFSACQIFNYTIPGNSITVLRLHYK